ncbi:MAG TPA: polysaccharide export protein EpsE [Candidatus Desulfobacillus sp.]|nr:polysaccharide export protein EpsE [Candidatus Desulfobacillus sp.]
MRATTFIRFLAALLLATSVALAGSTAAQAQGRETTLGAGDVVRVTVFQNPDLTTETRVSESGAITFPLVGAVPVGGLSVPAAERKIADMLREGGFVLQPQVNLLVVQSRSNQVSVLGQVNRPGRYPLDTASSRLTDVLAQAGGVAPTGDDVVILSGERDGKPVRLQIDVGGLFARDDDARNLVVQPGDTIYVNRAPMFYIYGEVQRPGGFRVERDMTVMQALAQGGGPTLRGTVRGLQLHRKTAGGAVEVLEPALTDRIQPEDVLHVQESLF